jgi:hypothetical protein
MSKKKFTLKIFPGLKKYFKIKLSLGTLKLQYIQTEAVPESGCKLFFMMMILTIQAKSAFNSTCNYFFFMQA